MPDFTHLAMRYIALWNETDATRRRALLAKDWTPNATYADPLAQRTGYAEIDTLIAAVQARFPGYRFALDGPWTAMASICAFPGGSVPRTLRRLSGAPISR